MIIELWIIDDDLRLSKKDFFENLSPIRNKLTFGEIRCGRRGDFSTRKIEAGTARDNLLARHGRRKVEKIPMPFEGLRAPLW